MRYILESTFVRIFQFLEPTHPQETHIYINLHNLHTLFFVLLFLSSFDSNCFVKNSWLSKSRKMRAKVDSESLYGRRKLLPMGSCYHISNR